MPIFEKTVIDYGGGPLEWRIRLADQGKVKSKIWLHNFAQNPPLKKVMKLVYPAGLH
jgi:hypothetical protein